MSGVPGPANCGSSPFGSVCTMSPIASVVTDPAITRRETNSRLVAPTAIPTNVRRLIGNSFSASRTFHRVPRYRSPLRSLLHGAKLSAPLGRRGAPGEHLLEYRRNRRRRHGADLLVGDPAGSIDDERLGDAVDAV